MSRLAFWLCAALLVGASFFYYPKWQQPDTEATISWDVSGYYLYLPALFIYHDLKQVQFFDSTSQKYRLGPGMGQVFKHEPSGNYVMKYASGQALQYLPWFTAAHLLAKPLGYPADGFSRPYQAAITWGSLLVALLGLWVTRLNLLRYFSDRATAIALLCLAFGTNYLNYAAFDGAMTHNWLFTLYSLLVFSIIRFYQRPSFGWAAAVGLWVGWAVLTRPTEIVALLLPLLWGIGSWTALRERLVFFQRQLPKIALALVVAGLIAAIQPLYWHYVSGEWLVYSYGEQSFSWLRPHLANVLFSARAGWLIYSPMMIFAGLGFFQLRRRQPAIFPGILTFCLVFLYFTAAWDIWWYGGSLGMRALVQSYALWIFPLAAFAEWVTERSWRQWAFPLVAGLCIYGNLWWTHQAHRGDGLFLVEQMTRPFMLRVFGHWQLDRDWLKLLDTEEEFRGAERGKVEEILVKNFDADSLSTTMDQPLNGAKSLLLNKDHQFSPEYPIPLEHTDGWLRAAITFQCESKEWEYWKMTQFVLRFYDGDQKVKERMIRLQRHVDGSERKTLFFDTRLPDQYFDRATVFFWNADGDKTIRLDDLRVEWFKG
ncbi:MAG: glycosyltransferase family 39 protein [Saprospiraceae bacterium]